jgi:hypothetical protein
MCLLGVQESASEKRESINWWEDKSSYGNRGRRAGRPDEGRARIKQAKFWEDEHLGTPAMRDLPPAREAGVDVWGLGDAGESEAQEEPFVLHKEAVYAKRERSMNMRDITRFLKLSSSLYDGQDESQWFVIPSRKVVERPIFKSIPGAEGSASKGVQIVARALLNLGPGSERA